MTPQSKTLTDAERVIQDASDRVFGLLVEANATNLVIALDRAGLLVTDLHRRALEACEALAAEYGPLTVDIGPWNKSLAVGRESLAAKEAAKPARKWYIVSGSDAPRDMYRVNRPGKLGDKLDMAYFHDEDDARAYVEQKNREEAAK